jgi:hypothetical protein
LKNKKPYLCNTNFKKKAIMARPIRETPILLGEDARRFEERMKKPRIVSKEERERVKRNYELVLKAATNFR